VTVHADTPCALRGGWPDDYALSRGNDWALADHLDGVGCSSFPKWGALDDAEFAARVEFVKSAARTKRVWLSEVQGGRAAVGFNLFEPVDAPSQQRWIWNGMACGADTMLFWCWRDEVFGRESGGFGIIGADGLAEERLAALRKTGALLAAHEDLLAAYRPAQPEVGVFFSPQTYYLHWAQEGEGSRAVGGLMGYCRALARRAIPYTVVEEEHLDALKGIKVLFMPRTLVVDDATAVVLGEFVKGGGTLVTESECGAFDSAGLYRYPIDRFTARLTGVCEIGRRALTGKKVSVKLGKRTLALGVIQWLTPWEKGDGRVLAAHTDGALLLEIPSGRGRVLLGGAYFGEAYRQDPAKGFEDFVEWVVRSAGIEAVSQVLAPKATMKEFVFIKHGVADGKRVVFVFLPRTARQATLRFKPGFFPSGKVHDIISGKAVILKSADAGQECKVAGGELRMAVLTEV
jgi:beta-galactosidase